MKLFKRVTADDSRTTMLAEGERLEVEHCASAEHHAALALMYRSRSDRLRAELGHAARPVFEEVEPRMSPEFVSGISRMQGLANTLAGMLKPRATS